MEEKQSKIAPGTCCTARRLLLAPQETTGSMSKRSSVPGPCCQGEWPPPRLLLNLPYCQAEVTTDHEHQTCLVSTGEDAEVIPPPLNSGTHINLKYWTGKGMDLQVQHGVIQPPFPGRTGICHPRVFSSFPASPSRTQVSAGHVSKA